MPGRFARDGGIASGRLPIVRPAAVLGMRKSRCRVPRRTSESRWHHFKLHRELTRLGTIPAEARRATGLKRLNQNCRIKGVARCLVTASATWTNCRQRPLRDCDGQANLRCKALRQQGLRGGTHSGVPAERRANLQ